MEIKVETYRSLPTKLDISPANFVEHQRQFICQLPHDPSGIYYQFRLRNLKPSIGLNFQIRIDGEKVGLWIMRDDVLTGLIDRPVDQDNSFHFTTKSTSSDSKFESISKSSNYHGLVEIMVYRPTEYRPFLPEDFSPSKWISGREAPVVVRKLVGPPGSCGPTGPCGPSDSIDLVPSPLVGKGPVGPPKLAWSEMLSGTAKPNDSPVDKTSGDQVQPGHPESAQSEMLLGTAEPKDSPVDKISSDQVHLGHSEFGEATGHQYDLKNRIRSDPTLNNLISFNLVMVKD